MPSTPAFPTRAVLRRGAFAVVLLALAAPVSAQMLKLESLTGTAQLQRGSSSQALSVGSELREQDVIKVGQGQGRAALRFARHGILELGPGTELSVERAPFASYADDLRSVFRLKSGYLRVIWKQPALNTNWPLFVYLGSHRASLGSGEYFFEKTADRETVCAAEGQLALSATGRVETDSLDPEACYRLIAGLVPQAVQRDPEDWVVVRQGYAVGEIGTDPSPPAATAAAPSPVPPIASVEAPPMPARPEPVAPAPKPVVAAVAEAPKPVAPKPAAVLEPAASPAPVIASPERTQPEPVKPEPVASDTAPRFVVTAPPEPPRAAPAATTAVTPGVGAWTLNLASFPERATAQAELEKVRRAGYPGQVQEAVVKGKTWYRVQVPGLASVQEAKEMAEALKKIGFEQAWVIRP